jgi:uncharacterized protein (DUF1501 family)
MTCTRREFLQSSALVAAATGLAPRLVFGASNKVASNRDVLVVIFQRGGMDSLNVVVPYADNDYYRLRPTIAVPRPGTGTTAALPLDNFFGLNPMMSAVQPLFSAGRLAIVAATGMKTGNRSHFECQDRMERAYPTGSTIVTTGWLDRHLGLIGNSGTFQAMGVGNAVQASLRGPAPEIGLKTIEGFKLTTTSGRAAAIAAQFNGMYNASSTLSKSARLALGAVDSLAAANPTQYAPENGATYPTTTFGTQLQQVAQIIKAGVGLEIAAVDINGWDHHDREQTALDPLVTELGSALAAFDTDMGGRMANITVITMTDFGRRAYENASLGTDHGTGSAMFVLGGGVAGGRVYALWPGLADSQLYGGDLDVTIDYRQILSELLVKRLGNSAVDQIFPGFVQGPNVGIFLNR